jgi:hypothetical protein
MYEWLEREIATIKTPRFHEVDGPVDDAMRDAIVRSKLNLPKSYREFVLKFGNARLYRYGLHGHRIHVFAGPREGTLRDGTKIFDIANDEGATIFVHADAVPDEQFVYEREASSLGEVAGDFADWLEEACARVRKRYGHEKWKEIERGPMPFNHEELDLLRRRKEIRWRLLGIDTNGDHIIEVTNMSDGVLPMLTLGVRSKDLRLNGAVGLDIGGVRPGQSSRIHRDCYKELVAPEDIELFALPEPRPEDRDYYWELRTFL